MYPGVYIVTLLNVQKKEQKDAETAEGLATGGKKKKVTAAQLRVQKGMTVYPSKMRDSGGLRGGKDIPCANLHPSPSLLVRNRSLGVVSRVDDEDGFPRRR